MSSFALGIAVAAAGAAVALAIPPHRGPPTSAPSPRVRSPREEAPGTDRRRGLLALTAGAGSMILVGGWFGVALGSVALVVVWRAAGRMETPVQRRRREDLQRELPYAVDLMAATLAAGSAPGSALRVVAEAVDPPLRIELRRIGDSLAWGVDPVGVWSEVGKHPQLGPLGRALGRAVDSGSPVSDAMEQLSEDLRSAARSEVESRARSVGVKAAAPLGICLLPAFVLLGVVPLVAGSAAALLDV